MRFEKELRKLLRKSLSNQFTGNTREWPDFIYDDVAGQQSPKTSKIKHTANKVKALLQTNKDEQVDNYLRGFDIEGLSQTYDLLSDSYSKQLLVRVIAFRMMGPGKIKMPLINQKLWGLYFKIKNLKQKDEVITKQYNFNLFDLRKIGYNVKLFYDELSIFINFGLKQYEYSRGKHLYKAKNGDYVVDGGACFGDTALYFASQVGPSGKVFAFEFIPDNLKMMRINLGLNPKLKKNVTVINNPLWSNSKKNLYVIESGPGSKVSAKKPVKYDFKVATKSIDDYVKDQNIKKIDFIKLDIEGAELECLKGAKETILKFKPKLAVCIYHDMDHFVSIPKYLHELSSEYDFFVDHFTVHLWETVLYAIPKNA